MYELIDIFQRHVAFSLATFDDETEHTALLKLNEELKELRTDLLDPCASLENVAEEYVDCILCLLSSAARVGIYPADLLPVFDMKVDKNMNRKWIKNEDGTYSHDKTHKTV